MQIKREKDMAKRKNIITEYRNYYLPPHFPVIALSGDYWKISDRPSGHLHFHNCLEIGICHSDSGCLELKKGTSRSFPAMSPTLPIRLPALPATGPIFIWIPESFSATCCRQTGRTMTFSPTAFRIINTFLPKRNIPSCIRWPIML